MTSACHEQYTFIAEICFEVWRGRVGGAGNELFLRLNVREGHVYVCTPLIHLRFRMGTISVHFLGTQKALNVAYNLLSER